MAFTARPISPAQRSAKASSRSSARCSAWRAEEGGAIDYLPLYVQDEDGWNNLCHLVSRAHLDRPLELEPHVALDDLDGHTDGLIALTGAARGRA